MLSIAYCAQIAWILFSKLYSRLLYNTSVIVIIRLILSVLLGPKAITLSGFHCITSNINFKLNIFKLFVLLNLLFNLTAWTYPENGRNQNTFTRIRRRRTQLQTDTDMISLKVRQINRQIDKKTERNTERKTDSKADRQTDRQIDRQTNRKTHKQTDRYIERQRERLKGRRIVRQIYRQKDMQ